MPCLLWVLIYSLPLVVYWLLCRRCQWTSKYGNNAIGFLHATSGAGGGGERVLWVAIDQLQQADIRRGINRMYIVYTNVYGGGADADRALLDLVDVQFRIKLKREVQFVYLRDKLTRWLAPDLYPRCTLLLQTVIGGCALFYEAAIKNNMTPVVIETVGVPMVYPLIRLLCGSKLISYTHYPIVSSSMIERVRAGTVTPTNKGAVATSVFWRALKLLYYQCFTLFYRFLGQCPHAVLTNSSWTQNHVSQLYWPRTVQIVYPPCDTTEYSKGCHPPQARNNDIVSVGQFRPEKNHMLQLRAFHKALAQLPKDSKLVMLGGVRNGQDAQRVEALRDEVSLRALQDRVVIIVNAPFEVVQKHLNECCIGLHTMLDEHFGIVLLEYLAAGCVALGHRSGGVQLDIIKSPQLGFLAETMEEYAARMIEICAMKNGEPQKYLEIQSNGMEHASNFGDAAFGKHFIDAVTNFLYTPSL